MKRHYLIYLFAFLLYSPKLLACHETTVVEVDATDNGDGTYTYDLEVCMGEEDSWGFEITFDNGNIIGVGTNCITDQTTICAGTPAGGVIEYGDYDDTSQPEFHEFGDAQICFNLSFVLDAPASQVTVYGTEYTYGPCAGVATTTSCFTNGYTLVLQTDNYGGETSWELLVDGTTTVVASGSGYSSNTLYNIDICAPSGCYDFAIYDSYGDGICCSYGSGSYNLYDPDGTLVATGGDFGSSETSDAGCVVLPVEYYNFRACWSGDEIVVKWATALEENANQFIVERSDNGKDFYEVGYKVPAMGNSTTLQEYEMIDSDVEARAYYYRVKEVNTEGVTYTPVLYLKSPYTVAKVPIKMILSPQPAEDMLKVSFNQSFGESKEVEVFNSLGQKIDVPMQLSHTEHSNELRMDVSRLEVGVYIIKVRDVDSGELIQTKFVKK